MSKLLLLSLIGLIVISGCIAPDEGATKIVDSFYSSVETKNYDAIFDLIGRERLTPELENKTLNLLNTVNIKLGTLQSYNLTKWKTTSYATVVGEDQSGDYIYLVYDVVYENYSAIEEFTIFKPRGTNQYFITNYHVSSDGFFV